MNSLNNIINYSGRVELELVSNKHHKVIAYNKGTQRFFNMISTILTGGAYKNIKLPSFIDIYCNDESILFSPAPITNGTVKKLSDNADSITGAGININYLASVSANNLKRSNVANTDKLEIKLLDSTEKDPLAVILVDKDLMDSFTLLISSLNNELSLSLKWVLTFGNSGDIIDIPKDESEKGE